MANLVIFILIIFITIISISTLVLSSLILVEISKTNEQPSASSTDKSTVQIQDGSNPRPYNAHSFAAITSDTDTLSLISDIPTTASDLSTTETPPGWKDAADLLLGSMDRSKNPCDDFYAYACNQWIAKHGENIDWWSITQKDANSDALAAIKLIDNSPGSKVDFTLKTIKTLFDACTQDVANSSVRAGKILDIVETYGGWPILKSSWSWSVDVPTKYRDFSYSMGWMFSRYDQATLLLSMVHKKENESMPQLYIDGPTLTMKTCKEDPGDISWSDLRLYMTNVVLELAKEWGVTVEYKKIKQDVDAMVELEQKLCKYTKLKFSAQAVTLDSAQKNWPNVNWTGHFEALLNDVFGYENITRQVYKLFYIATPSYVDALDKEILPFYTSSDKNRRIFQNYLLWRLVVEYLDFTGPLSQTERTHFEYEIQRHDSDKKSTVSRNEPIYGFTENECLRLVNQIAAFAVGRIYTDYMMENDALLFRGLILNYTQWAMEEFQSMVGQLPWMDRKSKAYAVQKVDFMIRNAVNQDFAFNDEELDEYYLFLSKVVDDPANADLFDVTVAINVYRLGAQLRTIGQESDRSSWGEDESEYSTFIPVTVNAWYQYSRNSVTIPAALLRSPFFRLDYPYAVNFGAIGTTIAHEILHGFNAVGQGFDMFGNPGTWMSDTSKEQFQRMAKCVGDQYEKFCYKIDDQDYCMLPDKTEEENLADNGGLKAAYGAYMATRPEEGPLPGLEDLSMEQIFFLSYGQQWCEHLSNDKLRIYLESGEHSPSRDRVVGSLQNFPPFAEAWKCKKGDAMYPFDSCTVW